MSTNAKPASTPVPNPPLPIFPCPKCGENLLTEGFHNSCTETQTLREDNYPIVLNGQMYLDHNEDNFETIDQERIVEARVRYRPKGALGKGADSWRSAAIDLRGIEQAEYPDVLDRYYSVLMKVAGLFPSIVRVKTQNKVGPGQWTSEVETLDGEIVSIKSDFEPKAPLAYLSVRGSPMTLRRKDWAAWIPADVPKWFDIQTISLWQGDGSKIGRDLECQFLDYKQRLPRRNIGKHLCAFANSMGGLLVFGIKDPKDRDPVDLAGIKGLTPTEATDVLDHVSKDAYPDLKPPVPSHFFRIYPDGVNLVLLCRVNASDLAPHTWQGRIYIRVGSQSIPIDETKWKGWEDFAAGNAMNAS